MKHLVPLLALVPLLLSFPISGHFAYPPAVTLGLLWALVGAYWSKKLDPLAVPLTIFWFAPVGLAWALSEGREGRPSWSYSIPFLLALFGIATLWLLRSGLVTRKHVPFIFGAILTWCVCYLSGSTGGADNMKPYYSWAGLSAETTWELIKFSRKLIHVTFYSALATCTILSLLRTDPKSKLSFAYAFSLLLVLVIACCDEWRQSMMPNRSGSAWDVLLDLSGAAIFLFLRFIRRNSTTGQDQTALETQ